MMKSCTHSVRVYLQGMWILSNVCVNLDTVYCKPCKPFTDGQGFLFIKTDRCMLLSCSADGPGCFYWPEFP
jgi:hypothetical protein